MLVEGYFSKNKKETKKQKQIYFFLFQMSEATYDLRYSTKATLAQKQNANPKKQQQVMKDAVVSFLPSRMGVLIIYKPVNYVAFSTNKPFLQQVAHQA